MKPALRHSVVSISVAVSLLLASAAPALAALTASKPKPAPSAVVIDPAKLRSLVVHNNFGVMQQLNLIHQAKDNVDIARGNLLPRLNLGAIISGITAGPAFALSAISFLLPFLLPSNWANLHQSEFLLESQKVGFRLMELNNFASAYALYQTMLADMRVREVLTTQHNDLVYIRDWLQEQKQFRGNISQGDIDSADAQVNLAAANISQLDETLIRERASFQEMIALPTSNFTLADQHTPPSVAETIPLDKLVAKIQGMAPENTQVAYMIQAAQQARWSKAFGFLSGANLNVGVSNGTPSFSNLSGGAGFSIGFDYVPSLNLASDNIANLQLHQRELLAQELQLAQATQGSAAEAKKQIALTTTAENELISVAQEQFDKYTFGRLDLELVFQAERNAAQATATKVKAQMDLDQLRITLHRELLTDQFAAIPGCVIRPEAEKKDRDFLRRLFHRDQYAISIDEACMPAN